MKIKLSLVLSSIILNNTLYAIDDGEITKSKFFLIGAKASSRSSIASNIVDKSAHQSEFATLNSKIIDPEYQKELIQSVQTKEGLEKFIANLPDKKTNVYKRAIEQKQSDYLKKTIQDIQQGYYSTLNTAQIQEYKEKLNEEQKKEFEKLTQDAIVEKLKDEIPAVYKEALSSPEYKIFDSNSWDKNDVSVMMLGKNGSDSINSVIVNYEFDKANLYTRPERSEGDNDINFVYLTNGDNKTNITYNISSPNISFDIGISAQTPIIGKNSNLTINMPNNTKKVNLKDISVGFSDERIDDISLINGIDSKSLFKLTTKGDIIVRENNDNQIKLNNGATYELISEGDIEFDSALTTKVKTYDKKYYESEEKEKPNERWEYQVLDIADGANFRLKANNIQNKGFIIASGNGGSANIEANKFTNGNEAQSNMINAGDLVQIEIINDDKPHEAYEFNTKAKVKNKNFLLAKDSGEVKIKSKTVKNSGIMANMGGKFKIEGNLDTTNGTIIAGQSAANSELGGFYVTGATVLGENTKIGLALHKDSTPLKGDTAYNILISNGGILGDEALKEENIYFLKVSGNAKSLKIDEVKNTTEAKADSKYLKVNVDSSNNNLYYTLALTEEALKKPISELIVVNQPEPSSSNQTPEANNTAEPEKTQTNETKATESESSEKTQENKPNSSDEKAEETDKTAQDKPSKTPTTTDDEDEIIASKEDEEEKPQSKQPQKRPELSKEQIQALTPKIDSLKNITKTYGVSMFSEYEKAIKDNDQNSAYMLYDSFNNIEKSTQEFTKTIAKKQNIQNIINLSSAMNTQTRLAKLSDPMANYFATRELIEELNGEQYARSLIILSDVEDELVTRLREKKAVVNNTNTPNSFWFNTVGSKGKLGDDATLKMAGFSIGIDKQNDDNIIGVYSMLAKSKATSGDAKSDTNHVQFGSYARFFNGNYEIDLNGFYTLGINKNQRNMQFFGDNLNYNSKGNSHTFGLGSSFGYAFSVFDSGIIKPSIGTNFYITHLPELKEDGELGLKRDSSTSTLASITANVELRYYMLGGGYFYLVPGLESEIYKKDDSKISFNGYDTIAQSVSGTSKKTYATILGGTELKMTPNSSFNLGLGTKISGDEKYYNVNAGFKVKF